MPFSLIDSARHIALVVHKNADADSVGAACAFYSYLLRKETKVSLFCALTPVDPNLAFLPWYGALNDRFPKEAECVVSFDCGSRDRLGIETDLPIINFDHHVSNEGYGTVNLVNPEAVSTTEVVYDFFVANDIKINAKMALSLYAGLLDDSNRFNSPRCNAKTFAMAHDLLAAGADHAMCTEWLFNRRSLASVRVRGALFTTMKLLCDGQLALFEVDRALLEATGATIAECKTALDEAMGMKTVRAALMECEHPRGGVKLSLRSDGSVDASKVMERFGGGGHRDRAGARITEADGRVVHEALMRILTKEMA